MCETKRQIIPILMPKMTQREMLSGLFIYSFSLLEHLPYDMHLGYRNECESGPRQEASRPLSRIQRYLC